MSETASEVLPLRWTTPAVWVSTATEDVLALLCDHAHLERRAASNALDLLGRWEAWLDIEARVAAAQVEGPSMHSGVTPGRG